MFIRQKKNKSGSTSVQIISKSSGKYQVVKTIGSSFDNSVIEELKIHGKQEIERLKSQLGLFVFENDSFVERSFSELGNASVRTIGPELIFGKIYDSIGFGAVKEELFRHLVISRLAFPLSKLKTVDYLYRYQGVSIGINQVYRFLDKLNSKLQSQVEQIAFSHTLKTLQGQINIVFYDMTTLYFESSDEDDLRKAGFSKDGKHSNPQIFLGLLVGLGGYAIGYDIYEGNISEGGTLIPFIEKIRRKYNLGKPVIVADSGLLSNKNIQSLFAMGYHYIIGSRMKNESAIIKRQILATKLSDGQTICITKNDGNRLIVSYSSSRASKDAHNRQRGLQRLEKQIKTGKLTKSSINNKGYNKYLTMTGEVTITIDYNQYQADECWDGLKGYITNTDLKDKEVIENYGNLWFIEKAFRMSKTDLRIRPIYHRLRSRIEAHICISFVSYCIYKELERVLYLEKSELSINTASEITHNMYEVTFMLPQSRQMKSILLKMDQKQAQLFKIIQKYF